MEGIDVFCSIIWACFSAFRHLDLAVLPLNNFSWFPMIDKDQ